MDSHLYINSIWFYSSRYLYANFLMMSRILYVSDGVICIYVCHQEFQSGLCNYLDVWTTDVLEWILLGLGSCYFKDLILSFKWLSFLNIYLLINTTRTFKSWSLIPSAFFRNVETLKQINYRHSNKITLYNPSDSS